MSVISRRRQQRRVELLQVAHIAALTQRTGKHALQRVGQIVREDRRIPKRFFRAPTEEGTRND